jgi:hypothetical protein
MNETLHTLPNKRRYQPPTMAVYQASDLWRELGPAQALTTSAPSRQKSRELPSNPLRIPPSNTP